MAERVYTTCSVEEAFQRERDFRLSNTPYGDKFLDVGMSISMWMHYSGPECEPFSLYMRWGKHHNVLANITSDEHRKGRLNIVIPALEKLGPLKVENVAHPGLDRYLQRHDYQIDGYINQYPRSYNNFHRTKTQLENV